MTTSNVTRLFDLSAQVLSRITAFGGMGPSVLRLWQTGDTRIIVLLRRGGCTHLHLHDSRLIFQDAPTTNCPSMIRYLDQLHTLDIVCNHKLSPDFVPFLPSGLQQLHILCENHRELKQAVYHHRPQLDQTIQQTLLKLANLFMNSPKRPPSKLIPFTSWAKDTLLREEAPVITLFGYNVAELKTSIISFTTVWFLNWIYTHGCCGPAVPVHRSGHTELVDVLRFYDATHGQ